MLLSWYRNLLRYKSVWRNSFEVYDQLTNSPPKTPEAFAPTDAELQNIRRQSSEEEHSKNLKDLRKYVRKDEGEVYSLAQLKVRGDFRKLFEVLKRELEQASEPNTDV